MHLFNSRKKLIILGVVAVLFSSCAPSKKKKQFTYFDNLPNDSVLIASDVHKDHELRLKKGDVLSVKVSTLDDQSNRLFNEGVLSSDPASRATNPTLQSEGYRIDQEGNINFPVIGKISIAGKTVGETQSIITQEVSKQVKNPIVNVRLLNAQVSVIGEVKMPGSVNISDKRTSVLEALGAAGDIQMTGKKDNVLIIRTNNGIKEYARLDLTDINVYRSPYFYLQQDDVIIVDPTAAKERVVRGSLTNREIVQLSIGSFSAVVSLINLYIIIDRLN